MFIKLCLVWLVANSGQAGRRIRPIITFLITTTKTSSLYSLSLYIFIKRRRSLIYGRLYKKYTFYGSRVESEVSDFFVFSQ